jgi:hypothetical protein
VPQRCTHELEVIERLIERTTGRDPGYDRDLLADIDRQAWGLESDEEPESDGLRQ